MLHFQLKEVPFLSIESGAKMTLGTEFGVIFNSNRRSPEISDTSQIQVPRNIWANTWRSDSTPGSSGMTKSALSGALAKAYFDWSTVSYRGVYGRDLRGGGDAP